MPRLWSGWGRFGECGSAVRFDPTLRNKLAFWDDRLRAIVLDLKSKRPGVIAYLPIAAAVQHNFWGFFKQFYRTRC